MGENGARFWKKRSTYMTASSAENQPMRTNLYAFHVSSVSAEGCVDKLADLSSTLASCKSARVAEDTVCGMALAVASCMGDVVLGPPCSVDTTLWLVTASFTP